MSLAHVQHSAGGVAEQVHARRPGESVGQAELRCLGVSGERGQELEVVQPVDAQRSGPLEQQMQQIAGGQGVVEGAM